MNVLARCQRDRGVNPQRDVGPRGVVSGHDAQGRRLARLRAEWGVIQRQLRRHTIAQRCNAHAEDQIGGRQYVFDRDPVRPARQRNCSNRRIVHDRKGRVRGAEGDQTMISGLKRRKRNRQRIASVAARNRKDVPALQASQTRAGAQRSGSDESAGEETFRVWNYVLVNVVRVVVGRIEALGSAVGGLQANRALCLSVSHSSGRTLDERLAGLVVGRSRGGTCDGPDHN